MSFGWPAWSTTLFNPLNDWKERRDRLRDFHPDDGTEPSRLSYIEYDDRLNQLLEELEQLVFPNGTEGYGALAEELVGDVEAVQRSGAEDLRLEWPDLWATYLTACRLLGWPTVDG